MRSGLLSDLATVGYEIALEGGHVKLRYQKSGNPPDTVAVNQVPSTANAMEPVGRFSRRSALPSRRRSGRWHDATHVVKEQSVVP